MTTASQRVNNNISVGVSLSLVVMVSYLCIALIGGIAGLFVLTITAQGVVNNGNYLLLRNGVEIAASLAFVIFWLQPLKLSIKGWYSRLTIRPLPVNAAFKIFTVPKRYWTAFYFSLIRLFATCTTFFLLSIFPSILLTLAQKELSVMGGLSPSGLLLLISGVVIFLAGLIFAIVFSLNYFYADYIFLRGIEKNPFTAIILSSKLVSKNRQALYKAVGSTVFYYLSFIFIVSIPFALPRIKAIYAEQAKTVLDEYIKENGQESKQNEELL